MKLLKTLKQKLGEGKLIEPILIIAFTYFLFKMLRFIVFY